LLVIPSPSLTFHFCILFFIYFYFYFLKIYTPCEHCSLFPPHPLRFIFFLLQTAHTLRTLHAIPSPSITFHFFFIADCTHLAHIACYSLPNHYLFYFLFFIFYCRLHTSCAHCMLFPPQPLFVLFFIFYFLLQTAHTLRTLHAIPSPTIICFIFYFFIFYCRLHTPCEHCKLFPPHLLGCPLLLLPRLTPDTHRFFSRFFF